MVAACDSCVHLHKTHDESPCVECYVFDKHTPVSSGEGPHRPVHPALREAVRKVLDLLNAPGTVPTPLSSLVVATLQAAADLDDPIDPRVRALRAVAWLRDRAAPGSERMDRLDAIEAALK